MCSASQPRHPAFAWRLTKEKKMTMMEGSSECLESEISTGSDGAAVPAVEIRPRRRVFVEPDEFEDSFVSPPVPSDRPNAKKRVNFEGLLALTAKLKLILSARNIGVAIATVVVATALVFSTLTAIELRARQDLSAAHEVEIKGLSLELARAVNRTEEVRSELLTLVSTAKMVAGKLVPAVPVGPPPEARPAALEIKPVPQAKVSLADQKTVQAALRLFRIQGFVSKKESVATGLNFTSAYWLGKINKVNREFLCSPKTLESLKAVVTRHPGAAKSLASLQSYRSGIRGRTAPCPTEVAAR
ncbi:MAG: hypothetical protein V1821_00965 [bacterium]